MEHTEKTQSIGKSLLVPSVQELAKGSGLVKVPDRYDISDQLSPILSTVDELDLQVPVVDLGELASGNEVELEKLNFACQNWGFFQLVNHGVGSSLVEKFKVETQEFFKLPLEEKKRYWQTPTDLEGFGQAFVVSEEQKLDWADIFYLITLPKHQRQPRLLPMIPLPYRDTLEDYSAELHKLAMEIFKSMAKALKIPQEQMMHVFEEGHQSMRMNYYPPCPEPDKAIGLTPHSDSVALTILLQLNEMEGLQISKDGKWVPIKPLPDAFVVNVGDILEMVTNGIYRSIMHRAVVNKTKERLSVATFFSPATDKVFGPIPSLITPTTPARFRNIRMSDYFEGLFTRPLDGKAYLDHMRISSIDNHHG